MHLKLLYEKISTLQPKKLDAMIKMKQTIREVIWDEDITINATKGSTLYIKGGQ